MQKTDDSATSSINSEGANADTSITHNNLNNLSDINKEPFSNNKSQLPPDEKKLGSFWGSIKTGFMKSNMYIITVTQYRFIFSMVSKEQQKDFKQRAVQQAKAEGKGSFGIAVASMMSGYWIMDYFNTIPVQALLTGNPNSYYVFHDNINKIKFITASYNYYKEGNIKREGGKFIIRTNNQRIVITTNEEDNSGALSNIFKNIYAKKFKVKRKEKI